MQSNRLISTLASVIVALPLFASAQSVAPAQPPARPVAAMRAAVENYAELAYRSYDEAYRAALGFQADVNEFVREPADDADEELERLRQAWIDMRPAYGRTETFRFYEGPIDFGKQPDGTIGPEPLLNAWPLDEAYIDYVNGNPGAGIVNDPNVPITRATLVERNARDDEADVTTGFHAIEFLLWGQDTDPNGPGHRPARDFVGPGPAARRREYLKVATDLLVENLKYVVDEWAPGRDNYRARFVALDPGVSVAHMLTGMATLAGFEVAAERLATPLDSGSQEDEHSCFSDTTHIDIAANIQGVNDVYYGRVADSKGGYHGAALAEAVKAANPTIAARIDEQLATSVRLATSLDRPFDRTLATPPGSPQRQKVEALVTSLQTLARLFKVAGNVLGVNIVVMVEIEH
jgi:putative iron-regulated protein